MCGRTEVTWLPPEGHVYEDTRLSGATHASRSALGQALADEASSAWTALRSEYDRQAEDWAAWSRSEGGYLDSVRAALTRVPRGGVALEVGAGTGEASSLLAEHFSLVVSSDVSWAMLRQSAHAPLCVADVRRLPLGDASVDAICGLNAVPHPEEFTRVLGARGVIVWCTSFGPHTPLYVSPDQMLHDLGDAWSAIAARAGAGEWAIFSRERVS